MAAEENRGKQTGSYAGKIEREPKEGRKDNKAYVFYVDLNKVNQKVTVKLRLESFS